MLSLTNIIGIATLFTLAVGVGVVIWSIVNTRRRYYAEFMNRTNQNGSD